MSTRFLMPASLILLLTGAIGNVSCAPKPELRSYTVNVLVEREAGVPAPGIALEAGGKAMARSDVAGRARLALHGFEGATVALEVRCPADSEAPQALTARLLTLAQGATPTLHALCAPKTRRLAVVVRAARGSYLPVVYHAKTLGVTDSDGVAHVVLEGTPGDSFELTLDTAARPDLRPQNPGAFFAISGDDSVTKYDTAFSVAAPAAAPHARVKAAPKGPVRIH